MDVRRALPFLLLVICTINAFSIHNGRGGPNNVRRVRRISEYLVPPSPPPRSHPSNRIPRLANDQSNEPGYFMRFMQMLNPFYSPPPLPSPLSLESAPLPAATYNSPSVSIYETPPPSSINGNSEYSASTNTKNCNPCNKEPWMPLKQDEPARLTYPSNGGYPPRNPEAPYDVHSAASQEIRTPDFSYAPPLPGQESIISPLPNPHLYLGVMPPLFKPENFNKPEQVAPGSTVSFPDTTGSTSNDGSTYHYYPEVVSQEPEHINPDLLPSSSQVTKDFENVETAVASVDEIFGPRQDTSTESHSHTTDYYDILDPVPNESKITNSTPEKENIPPSDKVESLWNIFATPSTSTVREPIRNSMLNSMLNPDDDITEDILHDNINVNLNYGTSGQQDRKRNPQVQLIIPYTIQYTPLPFQPSHERKLSDMGESNHDTYDIAESKNRPNIVRPPKVLDDFPQPTTNRQPTTSPYVYYKTKQPTKSPVYYERKPDTKANNSINLERFQKNIDNWTIEKFSKSPNHYVTVPVPKAIPKEYFTTPKPISRVAELFKDNVGILDGFNFNDEEHKEYKERPKLVNHRMEGRQIQMIQVQNSTESSINASTTSEKDMWRAFPVGVSSVNKERVYIVTPQPQTTPRSNPENRKQKALENAGSNTEESKKASQTDTKETNKSNTFESIEKAYQVLPQAVNNLAVASTGPESGSLWNVLPEEIYRHFPGLDAHPKPPNVACCTQHLQKGHVPNDDGSSVENAQDDYLCPCR
ncbi:uncharacterized protein LOC112468728 isoform X1 [Temnothorax curvispinosus]|uniref:Uncharacterized protein LOC112468728 isoform X1 n=1 Tax=Temnothorax curvispinosus TaxID=300111 RepID=A0A6J1RM83_9HYME|nr:uncharacterized protein LOC112468728 isoform X1 [Temnothorax curvispinosus]